VNERRRWAGLRSLTVPPRLRLRRPSWRGRLRLLAVGCVATGLSLILTVAYRIWDPGAAHVQQGLATQLNHQWHQHSAATHTVQPIRLVTGKPFAFLRIPALGAKWRFAVVEGSDLAQLSLGPGHVPGTQLPGEPGNFAIAAHDITAGNPFLHLANVRPGASIYVTTVNGTYKYRVLSESVVRYTDVGVLDPVPGHPGQRATGQFITLISCTPVTLAFTPWRVVVAGTLVGSPAPRNQRRPG
jgi:LPXTG-site transpeptidase (sortase) family protein